MTKHGLEGLSAVFWFLQIFTTCPAYASTAPTGTFSPFVLWLVELKLRKGSLEHGKTWFGRRFCCLVISAHLHNLPCLCIKMSTTGTYFTFLVIVEIKNLKKGSLEHGKTWFGRRVSCLVISASLQNLPCTCIKLAPTGTFVTFLVIVEIKIWKGKLRTWQKMVWKAFLLFGDLR